MNEYRAALQALDPFAWINAAQVWGDRARVLHTPDQHTVGMGCWGYFAFEAEDDKAAVRVFEELIAEADQSNSLVIKPGHVATAYHMSNAGAYFITCGDRMVRMEDGA